MSHLSIARLVSIEIKYFGRNDRGKSTLTNASFIQTFYYWPWTAKCFTPKLWVTLTTLFVFLN